MRSALKVKTPRACIPAATFLRKVNLGEPVTIGDRVAVIGGGITALDAAAVARRLGAEVHLVLDRPRGEIPAYEVEMNAVEAEGIHLFERTTATRILTQNGKVIGVESGETEGGLRPTSVVAGVPISNPALNSRARSIP